MSENNNRELGRIDETTLGTEDHGLLSFWLTIDFGGTCQGFGGYALGGSFTGTVIEGILKAVGVQKWEQLKGRTVWVRRKDGSTGFKALGGRDSSIVAIEAPDFVKHDGEFDITKAQQAFQASAEYQLYQSERKAAKDNTSRNVFRSRVVCHNYNPHGPHDYVHGHGGGTERCPGLDSRLGEDV